MDGTPERMVPDLRQSEARAYRRDARRRRRLSRVFGGAVLTVAAVLGDDLARALDVGPAPWTAALLACALGVVLELVRLPLAAAGWRASRAAGLSRQTARGWYVDRLKALTLGALVGLPAVSLLVWAQGRWPAGWPLAAWGASVVLSLLLAVVFPVVLLPLFLRSERLTDGPLRRRVEALVARSGLVVRDVRLLRMGAKTAGSNAAVTGIGPTRRILLGDTLVGLDRAEAGAHVDGERLAEVEAVLAHELAHHRHGDVWRGLALDGVTGLVVWLGAALLLDALPARLAHGGAGDPAALPALALALALVGLPAGLLTAWHSRRREWAADRYATELADPEAFARAFERLVADNLAELMPPRLERLGASHPPPAARIAAARRTGGRRRSAAPAPTAV